MGDDDDAGFIVLWEFVVARPPRLLARGCGSDVTPALPD